MLSASVSGAAQEGDDDLVNPFLAALGAESEDDADVPDLSDTEALLGELDKEEK